MLICLCSGVNVNTKQYRKLNKKEKSHLAECFDGSPSKVTLSRIKDTLQFQEANKCVCFDCNHIALKLGLSL